MDECESESKLITVEQAHRLKTWIRDESGTHIVPLVETLIRDYLNSPQFKKEYAKREELVEELIKFDENEMPYALSQIVEFIRTHGLEE